MGIVVRTLLVLTMGIVLVVVGGLLFLAQIDVERYRSDIETLLESASGHQVAIEGPLGFDFGWTTQLTADRITVSNRKGYSDSRIAEVEHISVRVDSLSLVFGPPIIEEFLVHGVRIWLVRDPFWKGNWTTAEEDATFGFANRVVLVRALQVASVEASYSDPIRRSPMILSLDHVTLTPRPSGIQSLEIQGLVNGLKVFGTGNLGHWQQMVDGGRVSGQMAVSVGRTAFSAVGSVGEIASMTGLEIAARLTDPAVDQTIETLGIPPFAEGVVALGARAFSDGQNLHLGVLGTMGANGIELDGRIDRSEQPRTTHLDFDLTGPNAQFVAEFLGVQNALPEPFRIAGGLVKRLRRFDLNGVQAEFSTAEMTADGWVDLTQWPPDGDLKLTAQGSDLSSIGPFADIEGLPPESFAVSGRVRKNGARWRFDQFQTAIGENKILATGELGGRGPGSNELFLQASGPDLSVLEPIAQFPELPTDPFELTARLRGAADSFELHDGLAVLGENRVQLTGELSRATDLVGSSLEVHALGPSLDQLAVLSRVPHLPPGRFDLRAHLAIEEDEIRFQGVSGSVGSVSLAGQARIVRGSGREASDLELRVEGPDVSELSVMEPFARLAGEEFDLAGRIARSGDQLAFSAIEGSIGNLTIRLDGAIGPNPSDLVLDLSAQAPDAEVARRWLDLPELPPGPLSMGGTTRFTEDLRKFINTSVEIGDYALRIEGDVHRDPDGTNLHFESSGADLNVLGASAGIRRLPAQPFAVEGRLVGTELQGFSAMLGEGSIDGELRIEPGEPLRLSGNLSADELDLTWPPVPSGNEDQPVFAVRPLNTGFLQLAQIHLDLSADRVVIDHVDLRDLSLGIKVENGALAIDPVRARMTSGTVAGKGSLTPVTAGHRAEITLNFDDAKLGLIVTDPEEIDQLPPFDLQARLTGQGSSWHELAASAQGQLAMTQRSGRVRSLAFSERFGDLLVKTFKRKDDTDPFTEVECGIYEVTIQDGVVRIDNLAIQTGKLILLSYGEIDLGQETLDVILRTRPREGIGIHLGNVAQLFKVGGSLREPKLVLDPGTTARKAGAAFLTGGLSLVARGFWDRIRGSADLCKKLAGRE